MEAAQLGLEDYYDFLNLGVKLTATACSDCPAAVVGEERMYAYTGPGKFSADSWFEAVKQGHTFITNGPMLLLTVQSAIPGDEARVSRDAKVRIHAQAMAPELIGLPKVLEVVAHGRVIRSVEPHGPKQEKLEADFELPASESQWIAARTTCVNGAVAHTTPVYLIVDGAGFFDRAQLPQLVAKRLKVLDWIEKRVRDPQVVKGWTPEEVRGVMASVQDAREVPGRGATTVRHFKSEAMINGADLGPRIPQGESGAISTARHARSRGRRSGPRRSASGRRSDRLRCCGCGRNSGSRSW
jgi:hypothetical protein